MSYNVQYGHVDRATLNRLRAELEAKIEEAENAQPTPDPEPTGETTDYEAVCEGIGGSWDSSTQICSVGYDSEFGPGTREYDTEALDMINECTIAGGMWNVEYDSCEMPETEEERCLREGGTWDPDNQVCNYPDPTPDPEEPGE